MIPRHKGEIPFLLLLLPFICGVFTGLDLLQQADTWWIILPFAVCCSVFILFNWRYKQFHVYRFRWAGGLLIALILFLAGWVLSLSRNELNAKNYFSKFPAQTLVIKVSSEPGFKNGIVRFTAQVEESINRGNKESVSGTLLVSIKDTAAMRLRYGDELLVPAKFKTIPAPLNPAEFNYKKYLADKNIYNQAFLYPKQYALLRHDAGSPMIAASLMLRQRLVQKLKQNIRDTGAYSVTSAMILGYRAELSSDIREAYSKTGALYVLNVSGAQIAIIYLVLGFLLGFLDGVKYGKALKVFIILSVVWYYALLTGFSVSVCRAAVMLSFVLAGRASVRYINTLNILAISAFALLCYNPFYLAEAGFQLSFLAVIGALLLRPVVYGWLSVKNKYIDRLWSLCSFSIAIQLAILPLCMFYFHQAPVYFLISNLFVIIPAALIIYSGILYLLLPAMPFVSGVLAAVIEKSAWLMNSGLSALARAPGASIDKIWLSTVECLLLYLLVACLFFFWYLKKVSWLRDALVCGLVFCLGTSFTSISNIGSKEIVFLSLGKHYGLVFRSGHKAVVLTDLADSDETFRYSVQPYLDSTSVNKPLICYINQDIDQDWLKKKSGFIQFGNLRILILAKNANTDKLPPNFKADIVYLTKNPPIEINSILKVTACKTIVVDGSNANNSIAEWFGDAYRRPVNIVSLKGNKYFDALSN